MSRKKIRMRTPCKFTLICEWMQQQNASLALLRLILTPLLLLLRWVRPLCCTNKFSDDSHGIQSRWIAWKDTHEKNTKQNKVFLFLNAIIFTWEAIQWSEYLFVFVFLRTVTLLLFHFFVFQCDSHCWLLFCILYR